MKIAFFGTPKFSLPVLEKITGSNHKIICVVTQPDRPAGRKQVLTPPPVKELAIRHNIPVMQPEKARDMAFLNEYKKLDIELNLIIAFGQILPEELIYFPKYHSVNIHASLLPKYRGASPINHAIINGDKQTGVTYQFIDKNLDTGDIIYQEKAEILDADDAVSLYGRLSLLSADTVLKVLDMISGGNAPRQKQDNSAATIVGLLKKEDGKINFSDSAVNIFNKIRGLVPWPGAFCTLSNAELKIWKAALYAGSFPGAASAAPGSIIKCIKNDGFVVKTGLGLILAEEVQEQSGKRMRAWDYCMGHNGLEGKILG